MPLDTPWIRNAVSRCKSVMLAGTRNPRRTLPNDAFSLILRGFPPFGNRCKNRLWIFFGYAHDFIIGEIKILRQVSQVSQPPPAMSAYYQAVCDELRERINPGDIDELGMKSDSIAHPDHPFGRVVVFAMLSRWRYHPIRLASDTSDDPGYSEYANVTEEVINAYNERYRTDLRFTGEPQVT